MQQQTGRKAELVKALEDLQDMVGDHTDPFCPCASEELRNAFVAYRYAWVALQTRHRTGGFAWSCSEALRWINLGVEWEAKATTRAVA